MNQRAEAAAGRCECTLSNWLSLLAGLSGEVAASFSCRLNPSMIDCGHLSDHKFLQLDEDDLKEWQAILEPDLSDLNTILGVVSQELALEPSDLEMLRRNPILRNYRRLRNTPYRTFSPSPKNETLPFSSHVETSSLSYSSPISTICNFSPIPSSSANTTTDCNSSISQSPASQINSFDGDFSPLPDAECNTPSPFQKTEKKEENLRMLLWLVQHLADQFGLKYEDIIIRFSTVLAGEER